MDKDAFPISFLIDDPVSDRLSAASFKKSLPWVSHPSNFDQAITPEHAKKDFVRLTSPHTYQE
jgi:hypothetical protein